MTLFVRCLVALSFYLFLMEGLTINEVLQGKNESYSISAFLSLVCYKLLVDLDLPLDLSYVSYT